MIRRPSLLRTGLAVLLVVFGLAACTTATTGFLGGAGSNPSPAAALSPAPGATGAPLTSPSNEPTPGALAPGSGGTVPGKQPGVIVCGPQMATQVGSICVSPADELVVAAAERALDPAEFAGATGARISRGAAACAVIPATDCSTNPPVAVVTFASSSGPAIVVIVRRSPSGQLEGERA